MMRDDGRPIDYNVLASFAGGPEPAERAADEIRRRFPTEADVRVVTPERNGSVMRESMRAEMQQEIEESFSGPSIGLFTRDQAVGAVAGTVVVTAVFAGIGFVIGLIWGFAVDSTIPPFGRVVIATVSLMVAGATIGFVVGGSLKPRMEGQGEGGDSPDDHNRLEAEHTTLVAVTLHNPDAVGSVEAVLRQVGAARIDLVDEEGQPLPVQHGHPRPADPDEDYWWRGQAKG
jgi:hypothetical protein